MIMQLFCVLILFSVVVGFGLASNHGNAWAAIAYSAAAVIALQVSYAATMIVEALRGR